MATIAIFGGTGYAGGAIRDEALRRGHTVISVSRKEARLTLPGPWPGRKI
jgi:putative NADH-flavin reductase